jgi:multidrug efflux pump subunit AcrA (membrane-fusion protein)
MNLNPIWLAIKGFCTILNGMCAIVPPLAWACIVALCLGHGAIVTHQRNGARAERDQVKTALDTLSRQVVAQKREASEKLAKLTAERDQAQAMLNDARRAQEIKDGNNQAAVDKARRDLRAAVAAGGERLRDPWAESARCGGGGAGADGGPGAGAGPGARDGAQTGGLLSAELTRRLDQRQLEADTINIAYATCRADVYRVRGLAVPAAP